MSSESVRTLRLLGGTTPAVRHETCTFVPTLAPVRSPIVVREPQRLAYLRTEVSVALHTGKEVAAGAAARELGTLWVVTAENPFSDKLSEADNRARRSALESQLDEQVSPYLKAVGRSPDGTWQEHSVALLDSGGRRARAIGREFGQNAVFEITPERLAVHGCFSRWLRSRPTNGPEWVPEPYGTRPLPELVEEQLGFRPDEKVKRFRRPAWRLDGSTRLPCHQCGGDLHLASALLQSRSGDWYDAKAILCCACRSTFLPSHLPSALREAVYLWSDWALVRADADAAPNAEESWSCYVVRLDDPTGTRLADDLEWVYVGESSKPADERIAELQVGVRASRWVRDFGAGLRSDLMADLPRHRSSAESKAYEAYLAARLRLLGYGVKGGH